MNTVKNEPVLAAVTGLVIAVLATLVAFGVAFTPEQTSAVVGLVAAVYAVAVLVRSKVTPTNKLDKQ